MTKPLTILIGSGNLGNAEPDVSSLAAWIPDDGDSAEVLDNQKCSLVMREEDFEDVSAGTDTDCVERSIHQQQFDIVVLGLQESTFEPGDEEMLLELKAQLEREKEFQKELKVAMGSDRSSRALSDSVQHVAKKASKAAKTGAGHATKVAGQVTDKAEKVARKGVATVNTLTASRDHTKDAAALLEDGTAVLHQRIQDRLPSYTRLLSFQRGEMRLLIYSLGRHHVVSIKSVRAQNTGMAGLANKGGIVAEVMVDEGTLISFMSCHLEAHEGISKYATRCSTLSNILNGTKKYAIPSIYPDASLATHFCFVMGDLNFRTRYNGHIKCEDQIEDVKRLVEERNWRELNKADELRMALENQECLYGFRTLFCNFKPTFKVERREGYVYKENRTPSYTDRILWRTGHQLEKKVKPLAYEPIDDFVTSDHKPIRGAFEIQLNRKVFLRKRDHHAFRGSVFAWAQHDRNVDQDNLHLFVCDIQCDIFPNSEWSNPDSYVCLVSSPEEILLKKPTKLKQLKSAIQKFLSLKLKQKEDDFDEERSSSSGWPRTATLRNTNNPDWKSREIHCVLKTQQDDAIPINLTGAILHIFLFKRNVRQTDEVIGSYPINLENVFRSCTLMGSHSMRKSWRRSIKRKSLSTVRDTRDNMLSIDINGPLLKNGRQTGVLRCTVDAWWINDTFGGGSAGGVMDPNHPSKSEASFDGSESSQPMFSSRKGTVTKHG